MINTQDLIGKSLALPAGAKVLDAGCGEGATTIHLAKKFSFMMTGIDLLPKSVRIAHTSQAPHTGLSHSFAMPARRLLCVRSVTSFEFVVFNMVRASREQIFMCLFPPTQYAAHKPTPFLGDTIKTP